MKQCFAVNSIRQNLVNIISDAPCDSIAFYCVRDSSRKPKHSLEFSINSLLAHRSTKTENKKKSYLIYWLDKLYLKIIEFSVKYFLQNNAKYLQKIKQFLYFH